MKEILDDEFNGSDPDIDLTSNVELKSFLYIGIMLIGGFLYMKYISGFDPTISNMLYGSIVLFLFSLIVCGIFTVIISVIRKRKDIEKGIIMNYDPIWFQVLVNGFFWWSVGIIIILVGKIIWWGSMLAWSMDKKIQRR